MSRHANISVFVPHLGCPHTCSFCNQHYIAGTAAVPDEDAVDYAVAAAKRSPFFDPKKTEIAFFGGSFTAIERDYMLSLLSAANKYIKNGDVYGVRLSTRPDAIDDEILRILKSFGVTTIEIGAQSMDDRVLSLNERGHNAQTVERAAREISNFGFSLGIQMMTGLYGASAQSDIDTARKISALHPDFVRIYPTITLKNTRLCELYKAGKYSPPSLEDSVSLCVDLLDIFDRAGIPVIRTGLHSIDESAYIAGPWHPAFRELCDARVFRKKIESELKEKGEYIISVNPKSLSKAAGQRRANMDYFADHGFKIKLQADCALNENQVTAKRL